MCIRDRDNKGIDIQGKPGAQARAIFDGKVAAVFQLNGLFNILIRHGNYISVYCNLASASVKTGDTVTTRQALGQVFSDGADNGRTVLHFQLRKEKEKLNPEPWLNRWVKSSLCCIILPFCAFISFIVYRPLCVRRLYWNVWSWTVFSAFSLLASARYTRKITPFLFISSYWNKSALPMEQKFLRQETKVSQVETKVSQVRNDGWSIMLVVIIKYSCLIIWYYLSSWAYRRISFSSSFQERRYFDYA